MVNMAGAGVEWGKGWDQEKVETFEHDDGI